MDLAYYGSLAVEIALILIGFYFGYLSFKARRAAEYPAGGNAKASLLFAICLMLVTLGFMLIIMTTDGTQISDYLAMFIMLELLFGFLVFLFAFIGQWIIARSIAMFKNKS
jgi:hypothetical protein